MEYIEVAFEVDSGSVRIAIDTGVIGHAPGSELCGDWSAVDGYNDYCVAMGILLLEPEDSDQIDNKKTKLTVRIYGQNYEMRWFGAYRA